MPLHKRPILSRSVRSSPMFHFPGSVLHLAMMAFRQRVPLFHFPVNAVFHSATPTEKHIVALLVEIDARTRRCSGRMKRTVYDVPASSVLRAFSVFASFHAVLR